MRFKFSIIAVLCCFIRLAAQDFENYTPLRNEGEIPEEFKKNLLEKVSQAKAEISKSDMNRREKNSAAEFQERANYNLDNIMFSGRLLYSGSLYQYVNEVADKVLGANSELRNQLRFYVLRTRQANAFATDQGIVMVTVGLLAQLENEAELAFILAHEASHYQSKHGYEGFKTAKKIRRGSEYQNLDFEEKAKRLLRYSKQNESEADKEGFEIFLKSGYNPNAAAKALDVLLYAYLPFDEVAFEFEKWQEKSYKFPEKLTLPEDKKLAISADESEDDEEKTHPNIGKRKQAIIDLMESSDQNSTKPYYLIGEEKFNSVQKLARFESVNIMVGNADYPEAYYNAWLLDRTYGSTKFSDNVKAMSFYGLVMHANADDDMDDYIRPFKETEGELQPLNYFFNKIADKDLNILGVRELYKYGKSHPSPFIDTLQAELLKSLFVKYKLSKVYFEKEWPGNDSNLVVEPTEKKEQSKVDKLKSKTKKTQSTTYLKYAFVDMLKDEAFLSAFKKASKLGGESSNVSGDDESEDEGDSESEKNKANSKKKKSKKEVYDDDKITSLILISPSVTYYNSNDNREFNIYKEQAMINVINKSYIESAAKLKFDLEILDKPQREELTTDAFNNMASAMDIIIERVQNRENNMKLFNSQFTSELTKTYKTNKLAITGFVFRQNSPAEHCYSNCSGVSSCLLITPLLLIFSKQYEYNHYTLIFDTRSGNIISNELKVMESTTIGKERILQHVYNSLYKIIRQKK